MTAPRYRGVTRRGPGRWVAYHYEDGVQRHIGVYDTPEAAAEARDRVSIARYGLGAELNFPERRAEYLHDVEAIADALDPVPPVDEGAIARLPIGGKHGAGREIIVDRDDLPKLEPYSWYAHLSPKAGRVYARARVNGHRVRAAHLIVPVGPGERVVYRNGDSLDLRRCNLRVVKHLRSE